MSVLIFIVVILAFVLFLANLWTAKLAREAENVVPQAGKVQMVEGGALHYVDSGVASGRPDAQVLLMIHGIAGQLQHFTYGLSGQLSDDFRVISVDRPGCGYSTIAQGDGASLKDQARMIAALLDKLGVEKVVVVGHSLGGAVALGMALEIPEKVAALALICPLTQDQPDAPEALKGLQISTPWLRRFLGATIAVPVAKLTADKVLNEAFKPEQSPSDFMDRAGAILGMRPQAFVAACSDMAAVQLEMPAQAARYQAELSAPGGVLYGAQDSLLSPSHHGHSMVAHGLTYEVLEGRGHMIPITAPDDCADFIRRMAVKA